MSVLAANCPSCAAPIEFKAGSTLVLICPYCRSAVARTDRGLNDLGKVAEIAESESPLKLGLKGTYNGNRFELTGRAQLKHAGKCGRRAVFPKARSSDKVPRLGTFCEKAVRLKFQQIIGVR